VSKEARCRVSSEALRQTTMGVGNKHILPHERDLRPKNMLDSDTNASHMRIIYEKSMKFLKRFRGTYLWVEAVVERLVVSGSHTTKQAGQRLPI